MEYRPRASDELVAGYETTSGQAKQRGDEVEMQRQKAGKPWHELAGHCDLMALLRAIDDDQFPSQRSRQRSRKVMPMDGEMMRRAEREGKLEVLVNTDNPNVSREDWLKMELALAHLSADQRECFVMHVAGRLTFSEIAELKGLRREEVAKQVARAKQKLRSKVKPLVEEVYG